MHPLPAVQYVWSAHGRSQTKWTQSVLIVNHSDKLFSQKTPNNGLGRRFSSCNVIFNNCGTVRAREFFDRTTVLHLFTTFPKCVEGIEIQYLYAQVYTKRIHALRRRGASPPGPCGALPRLVPLRPVFTHCRQLIPPPPSFLYIYRQEVKSHDRDSDHLSIQRWLMWHTAALTGPPASTASTGGPHHGPLSEAGDLCEFPPLPPPPSRTETATHRMKPAA